eukprot:TRINITY_DN14888_c0_g4_i2.p1 TRINITY_DN14888_c0_g4~~TRINITY_DN14888_c0_g4_i2.p1  ORF type:complete len:518 (-),score=2.07 TRINITY_DN14888_c0_g4_i2:241-1677(-)
MGNSDTVAYHALHRGVSQLVIIPAASSGPSILAPPSSPTTGGSVSRSLGLPAHGGAGAGADPVPVAPSMKSGAHRVYNLTFDSYRLSTNYTTYRCKVFDIPLTAKSHVVEFGGILNGSHPAAVHHAVVFGCTEKDLPKLPPTNEFDCIDVMHLPCSSSIGFWGVGGRPYSFPAEAGLPIGPGYYTKYLIQTHYTNPDGLPGIVDSSGIFLKVADQRRKYDAGYMLLGPTIHSIQIKIPPQQPSWTMESTCPSICTRSVFNETVKVIGVQSHMHTAGRQMYTDIYRDQQKLTTLSRLDYYDFNAQQALPVAPAFDLEQGDELKTTCVWDTTGRSNVTMGGEGTNQEMCLVYVMYYPEYPDRVMNTCFDLCVAFENNTISRDPTNPNLRTMYFCGKGPKPEDSVKPSLSRCSISYGEDRPLEMLKGCPNEVKASLSEIPADAISLPTNTVASSASVSTVCGHIGARVLLLAVVMIVIVML